MIRSKLGIFNKQGDINSPKSPVFELIRAFIPDLHICKFKEDPIKTEGLMVMIRSKVGIFSKQGNINL